MASWSTRRKYAYLLAALAAAAVAIGIPSFFAVYRAPTCSDGVQNGGETGVDCGGPCARLCPADYASPRVLWSYAMQVVPGVYNAMAYVANPNPGVEALGVPYIFKLYDAQGLLVAQRTGSAFIPAGTDFAVFENGIETGERIPTIARFQFLGEAQWQPGRMLSDLHVQSIDLVQGQEPKASVAVSNDSADRTYSNVDAVIVLYDKDGNRVAFSKTVIDSIAPGESKALSYTWPEPLPGYAVKEKVLFAAPPAP